jgi:hypothetical protein
MSVEPRESDTPPGSESNARREPIGSRRRLPGRRRPVLVLAFLAGFVVTSILGAGWALGLVDPDGIRLLYSEPYRLNLDLARTDPVVESCLGEVEGFGLLPRGQMHVSGREGWCEIEVIVRGARSEARLESRLVRRGGRWFWEWANLRLGDGTLVTLAVP